MLDKINTPKLRAVFYGLIFISSLAVFGNVAELCDIADTCPARLAVIIAIGVFTTIISAILFVGNLFEVRALVALELIVSVLLLVSFSVCVGLASSFRTNIQETIALSFSWVGLALTFVATFLALTVEGGILTGKRREKITVTTRDTKKRKDLEVGEEVPEDHYMGQVGEIKQEIGEEAVTEESKDVPMVSIEEEKKGTWLS